ncbi:MAG: glycosyltransferase family 2 protein [Candidatus Kapabacteria bacterium]|nr:glycosyltransferase family 2 protein [Candidatus Kapabacteria bacterium]
MESIFLSLIIPAYNEESRISGSLDKALEYFSRQDYSWEIIVVDDGSTDQTARIIENYNAKNPNITLIKQVNIGKGSAVRNGMLAAHGKYRVFTDADFSTPIYELEKILPILSAGTDICIGSRSIDRSMVKEHQPFYREWMGKTFNKFVQLLVFKGIVDTQCGFKGFTASAAERIFSQAKINGFSFDVEVLFLAKLGKMTIKEVPIEWYNDERSKVNPISDSTRMFLELIKIRRLHK